MKGMRAATAGVENGCAEGGGAENPPGRDARWPQLPFCPFASSQASTRLPECAGNVDGINMMEIIPNESLPELPSLSCSREISSIPKANSNKKLSESASPAVFVGGCNWVYPSDVQFFRALKSRNKEVAPQDIPAVVHVHNLVNETTWREIQKWEQLHKATCTHPSLIRFAGKSDALTVKAFFKSRFTMLGAPFDRHDWLIDRCGVTVPYIIEYYDDKRKTDSYQITVDARPKLSSIAAVFDRTVWMPLTIAAGRGCSFWRRLKSTGGVARDDEAGYRTGRTISQTAQQRPVAGNP